jgi:hypothetical protein
VAVVPRGAAVRQPTVSSARTRYTGCGRRAIRGRPTPLKGTTMKQVFRTSALVFAAIGLAFATQPSWILADTLKGDSMKGAAMDCKNADPMMMKMAHSEDSMMAMKMSGNTDRDFAHMMMNHEKAMMAMAKLELKCAKDARMKQMAQHEIERLNQIKADLDLILHTP